MSTGFYQNGVCYARQQDAVDSHFQAEHNSITAQSLSTVFVMLNKNTNGSWSYQKTTVTDGGVSTQQFSLALNNPIFSSCETVDFSQYDITPANVLYVLTWGLSFLLIMWSLGYAIGAAKTVINKV